MPRPWIWLLFILTLVGMVKNLKMVKIIFYLLYCWIYFCYSVSGEKPSFSFVDHSSSGKFGKTYSEQKKSHVDYSSMIAAWEIAITGTEYYNKIVLYKILFLTHYVLIY